jgi:MoaA/NifB/PqqE/SkfB family radical SAM enzyme
VTRIKSNGHAINARVAERIRNEIDPFIIDVSIHGACAETHDRQTRVPGSFDRLIANIGHMKSAGIRVKANCVLTRWNEDEVAALLSLADQLGVILAIDTEVKPRDDGDRGPLEIEATESGRRAYRQAVRDFEAKRGETVEPLDRAQLRERRTGGLDKHCGAGASTLTVDPFGNVLPCVQWRVAVGNLHEQCITQIWQGSPVLDEVRQTNEAVRKQIASLGDAGPLAGFCPGAAHTYHGNPLAMYPTARARLHAATREVVRLTVL